MNIRTTIENVNSKLLQLKNHALFRNNRKMFSEALKINENHVRWIRNHSHRIKSKRAKSHRAKR